MYTTIADSKGARRKRSRCVSRCKKLARSSSSLKVLAHVTRSLSLFELICDYKFLRLVRVSENSLSALQVPAGLSPSRHFGRIGHIG